MQILKKVHLLQVLLLLNISFSTSISQETSIRNCGKIRIQSPFSLQSSTNISLLNYMLLCKAEKLYFRTSQGLFLVSSIDYETKLLTISHSFYSSTTHFTSPITLSAGFPEPPRPNSLLLYNCSSKKNSVSPYIHNCTSFPHHKKELPKGLSNCFLVEDINKLEVNFHPKKMNCTHYSRMYRNASFDSNSYGFQLGTRISFDIPDHVPNPCDQCKKPNGNCGIGLRCICHPKDCKDKVISIGVMLNPFGNMLFSFLCFVLVMELFNNS
ncbi:hypothetical protein ACH5RR_021081 [Cinchona calisaya]|uniref:Uncharacterized protein n=1 Tax=Cinchona calisaya TaxID=153742 RepID=A0ABD2ZK41_9GENT